MGPVQTRECVFIPFGTSRKTTRKSIYPVGKILQLSETKNCYIFFCIFCVAHLFSSIDIRDMARLIGFNGGHVARQGKQLKLNHST